MRAWTTGLVGIVVAGLLLGAAAACTGDPDGRSSPSGTSGASGPTDTSGASSTSRTSGTSSAGSAGRPRPAPPTISEEMPPLPVDPHAAMVEVRRLLVEQMAPLLADSGQRWTEVRFLLTTSEIDETAYQGYLFVTVAGTAGRYTEGIDPPERLAKAARARGWDDGGISHRLNMVRGPYHLTASFRPDNESRYELTTPPLNPRTLIEGTAAGTDGVPELEGYREKKG